MKKVIGITKDQYSEWIIKKHYAHRLPCVEHAFGLYIDNVISGVCTFGPPARQMNNGESVFNKYRVKTFELNRLVIKEKMPKDSLSFFVAEALSLLPKPCCVVSYADATFGHKGYIYQATNWIYTGLNQVDERKIIGADGKDIHPRTAWELAKKAGYSNTSDWVDSSKEVKHGEYTEKHRYFMFLGDKRQKKIMKKDLIYRQFPYPKGDTIRYKIDDEQISSQQFLF